MNVHSSSTVVDMCAAIEEYEEIARSGRFSNGEPTSNDPELVAELLALAADLRTEIKRREGLGLS